MRLPRFVLNRIIRRYVPRFGVRMDEAEVPEGGFRSLDQFFTRILRPGARQADARAMAVVSPVDARIDEFGEITEHGSSGQGIDYRLPNCCRLPAKSPLLTAHLLQLYLSPGDYHRIHFPV